MRWRKPKDGDTRFKKSFLLLPRTIQGVTRWLEMAKWEQRYSYTGSWEFGDCKWVWKDYIWIEDK